MDCPFKVYFVTIQEPKHQEQYSVYHAQTQAECFMELKQKEEKNADTVQRQDQVSGRPNS